MVSIKYETLRNGLANLMGGALPIAVVIFTTPYVVNKLGTTNYGLLTLITAIIGYFAIIDLNFSAGSLKYVSEYHATGAHNKRNQTLMSGFFLYLLIGTVGGVLIFALSDYLVLNVFQVDVQARGLAVTTLKLSSFAFLFGQLQIYLNTVPQALRRYDQSAMVESIFGMLAPIANVIVLWLGGGLFEIVAIRVAFNIVNLLVLFRIIRRLLPDASPAMPTRSILVQLAKFSGFAYLSRLTALAYAYGDKLILGAITTMTALTYYTIPFILANRVYSLCYRLSEVLLPVSSALAATNETVRLRELYLYATRYIFYLHCTLTFLLVTLAHEILYYWIGPDMASAGTLVLILIAFANLADSLTNAPSLVTNGLGKPKITGLFAIMRALTGLLATFILAGWLGIQGAAIAQLTVSLTGAIVFLWYVHGRTVPVSLTDYLRVVIAPGLPLMAATLLLLWVLHNGTTLSLPQATALLLAELITLVSYGYVFVIRKNDLQKLIQSLGMRKLKKEE